MRYLIFTPYYRGDFLHDEFNNEFDIKDLNLPENFLKRADKWHALYKKIIPLSEQQRKLQNKFIQDLDQQGLQLARELQSLLTPDAKVKYFSEGRLTYLPLR